MSPKAFTETEKELVREKLIDAAGGFLSTTGIKKTTVEQLAKAASISKGAFYSFYQSKELLFMDALDREQESIHQAVIDGITSAPDRRSGFVSAIAWIYRDSIAKPWLLNFSSEEYELLLRRIPKECMAQHIELDDASAKRMMQSLGEGLSIQPALLSATLRMLFFGVLHRGEVGEEWADAAFMLMVDALADRLFGGTA